MEEVWTGHLRPRAPFHLGETKFYTVHLASYFTSASWEQVRELCVIAIDVEAFETLIAESRLKAERGKARKPILYMDGDNSPPCDILVDRISRLRSAPAERNLLACISRSMGYIDLWRKESHPWFRADNALIWELVNNVYKFHKKGDLEPELPFLRISKSHETQEVDQGGSRKSESDDSRYTCRSSEGTTDFVEMTIDEFREYLECRCCKDPYHSSSCSNHRHPIPPLFGNLQVSDTGAVLVHGRLNHAVEGRSPSDICVYIVKGALEPPTTDDLARIIKETFENRDVYHTTRYNGTLTLRAGKSYRSIWNLSKSYGVFFSYDSVSFAKWLEGLNQPLPTRQGSGRGRHDSGRSIFEREYSPWHDPRLSSRVPSRTMRKRFRKSLLTAEAIAWASIAKEKISRGVKCCAFCAREDIMLLDCTYRYIEDDYWGIGLCYDCSEDLDPNCGYGWRPWAKELLRKVLKKVRSEGLDNQTNGYYIGRVVDDNNSAIRQKGQSSIAPVEGRVFTRKRKRT